MLLLPNRRFVPIHPPDLVRAQRNNELMVTYTPQSIARSHVKLKKS